MHARSARLAVGALALAFALVGCNDDADSADSIATTTVDPSAPAAPPEGAAPDGSTPATPPTIAVDPAQCKNVTDAFSKIAANAAGMTGPEAVTAIDEMNRVLPEDLHDDFRSLIDSYASGDMQSATASMQTITGYLTSVCGPIAK